MSLLSAVVVRLNILAHIIIKTTRSWAQKTNVFVTLNRRCSSTGAIVKMNKVDDFTFNLYIFENRICLSSYRKSHDNLTTSPSIAFFSFGGAF